MLATRSFWARLPGKMQSRCVLAATVAHIDLENRYDAASILGTRARYAPTRHVPDYQRRSADYTQYARLAQDPRCTIVRHCGLPTSVGAQPPTVRPATSGDTPRREEMVSEELPKLDAGTSLSATGRGDLYRRAERGRARQKGDRLPYPAKHRWTGWHGSSKESHSAPKAPARKTATSSQPQRKRCSQPQLKRHRQRNDPRLWKAPHHSENHFPTAASSRTGT